MRRLFCPVAAHRHAAPASRASTRMVCEHQGAAGTFASLDCCERMAADELCQFLSNDQQQRPTGLTTTKRLQLNRWCIRVCTRYEGAESVVGFKESVQPDCS